MSKPTVVLFIAALASAIVFAGQAEAKAVVKPSTTSVNTAAPLAVSNSLHFSTLDASPFPKVPDIVIYGLLAGRARQPCWMRPPQYERQVYSSAHTGRGTRLTTSGDYELMQQGGQSKLVTRESLSGNFSSFSPPGLILRL